MENALKFTPTSTVDIKNASEETGGVIFKNLFKDENGEPVKYFKSKANSGAGLVIPSEKDI